MTAIRIACLRFFSKCLCRFCAMSVRALVCLFKAIAIAVYKTVITTNGAIKSKDDCANLMAVVTCGSSTDPVWLQSAFLLSCTTTSAVINDGELSKPAKIQVETMAVVRIFGEIRPSFIGKTTATNLSIAIHTKLWEETWKVTAPAKLYNLQKIDPKIPLTRQCQDSVTNPVILTGITIRGKSRSDTAMFTMK